VNSKIAPLLTTIGLAAASGVGGAWLGSKLFSISAIPQGSTHEEFHERLFSELRLSPAQRALMEALEVRHAPENRALRQALASANRALADQLATQPEFTNEVEAAVVNVHAAMLDLQKASVRHLYEMRDILNDRQKETFDRHVAETMQIYASQSID
jgi:nickel and cobalt resistance protein CnrR